MRTCALTNGLSSWTNHCQCPVAARLQGFRAEESENVSAMLDAIPNTRVPLAITGNRDPGPLASVLESRTTAVTAATVTTVTRTVTVTRTRRDRDVVTVMVTRGWERDRRTVGIEGHMEVADSGRSYGIDRSPVT
jgi:hypothetical protein